LNKWFPVGREKDEASLIDKVFIVFVVLVILFSYGWWVYTWWSFGQ